MITPADLVHSIVLSQDLKSRGQRAAPAGRKSTRRVLGTYGLTTKAKEARFAP